MKLGPLSLNVLSFSEKVKDIETWNIFQNKDIETSNVGLNYWYQKVWINTFGKWYVSSNMYL